MRTLENTPLEPAVQHLIQHLIQHQTSADQLLDARESANDTSGILVFVHEPGHACLLFPQEMSTLTLLQVRN